MINVTINTETLTTEEARALAIFLMELRGIPRDALAIGSNDGGDVGVDAGAERPDNSASGEGNGAKSGNSGTSGEGQNTRKASGRVPKESPVFLLANKKTGVSIECNTGRKGEVEAAKGHIETWIRDAATVEEVAGLAADVEAFASVCLSKKEQQALAKLVTEIKQSLSPEMQQRALIEATALTGAAPPADAPKYTLDAVKAAGKALATAKGLPAVETVLAKFDVKSFKDLKEENYAGVIAAVDEALK